VGAKPRLLGRDLGPPRGEELADLVAGTHHDHATSTTRTEGGAVSTAIDVISLITAAGFSMEVMAVANQVFHGEND
jgi:hypothetical protein